MVTLDVPMPEGIDRVALCDELRRAGARFAYVHGSWADGTARAGSDVDVAAWFGRRIGGWDVVLDDRVAPRPDRSGTPEGDVDQVDPPLFDRIESGRR